MIAFAQIILGWVLLSLFDATWDQSSFVLDVAAVAAIVGSVAAYNRLRTALTASEASAKAWHEEREAALARAERLQEDLKAMADEKVKLLAKVAALEGRPDLTRLEGLVAESTESMKRHELSAAIRTDRLIVAIESIGTPRTTKEEETQ